MDLLALLNAIDDAYSEPELQGLCAQLGVDYRLLPGYAKRDKVRGLVAQMEREGQLPALAAVVAAERPALSPIMLPFVRLLDEDLAWLDNPPESIVIPGSLARPPAGDPLLVRAQRNSEGFAPNAVGQPSGGPPSDPPPSTSNRKETPPNPYTPGRPVAEPDMFFGRAAETRRLAEAVAAGQHVLVVGPHRIGKSSLLQQVARSQPVSDRLLRAYVPLGQESNRGKVRLAHAAWEQWWTQVRPGNVPVVESATVFEALVRKLEAAGYRLLLALDDLEQLAWRPRTFDPVLISTLKRLASEQIITILGGSRLPQAEHVAPADAPDLVALADFAALFRPLDLGLLDGEAARATLVEPLVARGLRSPEGAADHLLDLCGPHPFFLHLGGLYLYEGLSRRSYSRALVAEQFQAAAEPFWQELFESLSPPAQAQLLAAGQPPASPVAERQMRIMANRGVLLPESGGYRPFSQGFARWLARMKAARQAAGL